MSAPTTPKEIYEHQLRLAIAGDRAAQMEFYAPDAVVEFPFAPPGVPDRFEGREQILAMSVALDKARPQDMHVIEDESRLVVHETTDPEVVVGEIDASVDIPGVGQGVQMRQIHVVRVRGGKIIQARDYHAGATTEIVRRALGESSED